MIKFWNPVSRDYKSMFRLIQVRDEDGENDAFIIEQKSCMHSNIYHPVYIFKHKDEAIKELEQRLKYGTGIEIILETEKSVTNLDLDNKKQ